MIERRSNRNSRYESGARRLSGPLSDKEYLLRPQDDVDYPNRREMNDILQKVGIERPTNGQVAELAVCSWA